VTHLWRSAPERSLFNPLPPPGPPTHTPGGGGHTPRKPPRGAPPGPDRGEEMATLTAIPTATNHARGTEMSRRPRAMVTPTALNHAEVMDMAMEKTKGLTRTSASSGVQQLFASCL